jgi:hypothetical protein
MKRAISEPFKPFTMTCLLSPKTNGAKYLLPVLLLAFSGASPLHAQAPGLMSHLGGFPTQYRITSGEHVLNEQGQFIVVRNSFQAQDSNASSAPELRLEFEAHRLPEGLRLRPVSSNIRPAVIGFNLGLWVDFLDAEGRVLHRTLMGNSRFNVSVPVGQEGLPFFFSIDLRDVPILLLEQAHQIDITRR